MRDLQNEGSWTFFWESVAFLVDSAEEVPRTLFTASCQSAALA